jgi:hypothetical protein
MPSASVRLEVAIDPEALGRIDAVRGRESRASWLRRAIEAFLAPGVPAPALEVDSPDWPRDVPQPSVAAKLPEPKTKAQALFHRPSSSDARSGRAVPKGQ